MSQEQIKAFISKASEDSEIKAALSSQNADVIAIAAAQGFHFTVADLIKYQAETTLQLSDDELEQVSGGISPTVSFAIGLVGGILGVGAPVAAATLNVCK